MERKGERERWRGKEKEKEGRRERKEGRSDPLPPGPKDSDEVNS